MSFIQNIKNGWAITKISLHYAFNHRIVMLFTFCSALIQVAIFCMFSLLLVIIAAATSYSVVSVLMVLGIPYLILARFIAILCATAQSAFITHLIEGKTLSVGQAFTIARQRWQVSIYFAITTVFVNKLVRTMFRNKNSFSGLFSTILGLLATLTWQAATFFMIPIIALEQTSFTDSIKVSANTFKKVWGESVSGSTNISALFFLVTLVGCSTLVLVSSLINAVIPPLGFLILVPGCMTIIIVTLTLSKTTVVIFRTITYLYATKGITGPFDAALIKTTFVPENKHL